MTDELSILIPNYNHCCVQLVEALVHQANDIHGLRYEVIVTEDGSTDKESIHANQVILHMDNCHHICREVNIGRAAIRNFLTSKARYQRLLFIDCDLGVIRDDYLERFLQAKGDVVYGSYHIQGSQDTLKDNLRFRYEMAAAPKRDIHWRQEHPYRAFRTCNFLATRDVMSRYPFDERFVRYGFEDNLFAKTLSQAGIIIQHIDNPLCFDTFESNALFLEKTEEGLRTLHAFRHDLGDFSLLLSTAQRIESWHLAPFIRGLHKVMGNHARRRLLYAKPPLWVFNAYKLGYFMSIQRHP